MTDYPNTEAPAAPTFAVVKTPIAHSVFNAAAYRCGWQPVQVVDFYRTAAMDRQLNQLQNKELTLEPTT